MKMGIDRPDIVCKKKMREKSLLFYSVLQSKEVNEIHKLTFSYWQQFFRFFICIRLKRVIFKRNAIGCIP